MVPDEGTPLSHSYSAPDQTITTTTTPLSRNVTRERLLRRYTEQECSARIRVHGHDEDEHEDGHLGEDRFEAYEDSDLSPEDFGDTTTAGGELSAEQREEVRNMSRVGKMPGSKRG